MDFKEFIRATKHGPVEGDKTEYFNLKARVSSNVLTNAQDMPTPGYTYDADITEFWKEFESFKKECGYPLTFNTVLMRCLVEGLKVAPRLNSYIEYHRLMSSGRLIIKKHVDVALPVLLDTGETFPVKVSKAEEKTLKELGEQIADLTKKVKTTDVDHVIFDMIALRTIGFLLKGQILSTLAQTYTGYFTKYKVAKFSEIGKPAPKGPEYLTINDINEGTVCLTNLGAVNKNLNGRVTNAPLLYPQVFLMAVGVARDENYVFRNEKGEIDMGTKKILPITLTFDHRIGGFGDILPFIEKLDEIFANPKIMREW